MSYFGTYQPGIVWVRSDQEVFDFLMLPNQSMVFRHVNMKTVYFKQTDASGRATIEAHDLIPHTQNAPESHQTLSQPQEDYVTRKEFDELVRRLRGSQAIEEVKEDE